MLTPALEKLVLCGKASYNTYVVGGAEKYILDVQSDRFIIITGLTYFSRLNATGYELTTAELTELYNQSLTQLRVFSKKSNNLFLFRDNFTVDHKGNNDHNVSPIGNVKLDTYLIHDSSVSFTFSRSGKRFLTSALMNSTVPGTRPPFDYGVQGIVEALPVTVETRDVEGLDNLSSFPAGLVDIPTLSAIPSTSEFTFPVDIDHYPELTQNFSIPVLLVEYVEILGNPTNIAATL